MPKFRTMRVETPEVATHLLENAEDFYYLTDRKKYESIRCWV